MKIHKINLSYFEEYRRSEEILFMRPLGSKLFRVCYIPIKYSDNGRRNEIVEILDATCKIKRYGTWYFDFSEQELIDSVLRPMAEIDLEPIVMIPEKFGRDKYGWPVEAILN